MTGIQEPIGPDVLSRARGCLLGQVIGDSLGSLVEFKSASRIRAEHPGGVRELVAGGVWDTLAGQITDDSEMALMLARSLADRGDFDDDAVVASYVNWYHSAFDMGRTTRRALSAAAGAGSEGPAAAARAHADTTSQANGALMRVSPLGVFGWALDVGALSALARRDASLTHPHAVCQDASALFVVTIARAISAGGSAKSLYDFACDWAARAMLHKDVVYELVVAERENAPNFSDNMGWVRIALRNAFYQLVHAPNLEEGVMDTVMRGGDTDTTGAIAGALLGAAYGEAGVPRRWRETVLSCRPEAGKPGVRQPRPREFWPVDLIELADTLVLRGRDQRARRSS